MTNTALKMLRAGHDLTQAEFAERVGVTRATYSMIESGQRLGRADFWAAVQRVFKIPDAEMWTLMQYNSR